MYSKLIVRQTESLLKIPKYKTDEVLQVFYSLKTRLAKPSL